jgi:HPt (histidine-containing phosphotransfer) domain-containing protein
MSQESSSTPPPAPLDLSRLEKLRDLQKATGRDLLTQVIDIYRNDTPQRLDRLRRALDEGDAAEAELLAHSIKGSSANVGAPIVVQLAAEIELEVAAGTLADTDGKLARLASEIDRACRALEGLRP